MKYFKSLLALILVFAAILSLGSTAFAEEAKTETKTFKDENGEIITEVYNADGDLIHREEPYYKNGEKTGTLCYDAVIWCNWSKEKYTSQAGWTLPIMKPETKLSRCLSFTLNMAYFKCEKSELGLQTIFIRENGNFRKAGYLTLDKLEKFDDMDFKYKKPTKVDGFAIQPYKYISTSTFSLACALTDVYYLK